MLLRTRSDVGADVELLARLLERALAREVVVRAHDQLVRRAPLAQDRGETREETVQRRRLDGGPPFDRLWRCVRSGLRRLQVEAVENRRHVDVVGLLRRDFDPVVSGLRRYGRRCDGRRCEGRRFYRSRLWFLGHPELEVDVGDA